MSEEDDATIDRAAATTPLRADDVLNSLRNALANAQADAEVWKQKAEDLAEENATLAARLRAADDAAAQTQRDLDALKASVAQKVGELAALVGAEHAVSSQAPSRTATSSNDAAPHAAPAPSASQLPAPHTAAATPEPVSVAVASPVVEAAFEAKATVMQATPNALVPGVTAAAESALPRELARSSLPDFEDDGTVEVHAQVARTTLDSEALASPAPLPSMSSDTDPESDPPPKS